MREQRPPWRRALALLVAVGLVLLKFGAKLKGLPLLLPKLKIFTTSATMLRREGIQAGAPMFIPFLGALVAMKELPKNAAAEARVGLAGPVLGSLGVLVPLGLYALTGDELFKALAFVGFLLNLFNLLPVLPLDGGRAMAALSPWMWFVGYALLVAATIAFPNPVMLLVLLFGGLETWRRWQARKTPRRASSTGCGPPPGRWWRPSTSASPPRWRSAWTPPSWSATSGTSSAGRDGLVLDESHAAIADEADFHRSASRLLDLRLRRAAALRRRASRLRRE